MPWTVDGWVTCNSVSGSTMQPQSTSPGAVMQGKRLLRYILSSSSLEFSGSSWSSLISCSLFFFLVDPRGRPGFLWSQGWSNIVATPFLAPQDQGCSGMLIDVTLLVHSCWVLMTWPLLLNLLLLLSLLLPYACDNRWIVWSVRSSLLSHLQQFPGWNRIGSQDTVRQGHNSLELIAFAFKFYQTFTEAQDLSSSNIFGGTFFGPFFMLTYQYELVCCSAKQFTPTT